MAAVFSPFLNLFDRLLEAVGERYSKTIGAVLSRPLAVVAVTVALFLGSLGFLRVLGSELIPELIQGEFFADIELPPGARLEVTDRRLVELTKTAATFDNARTVYTIAGTSNEQGGHRRRAARVPRTDHRHPRPSGIARPRKCRHENDP